MHCLGSQGVSFLSTSATDLASRRFARCRHLRSRALLLLPGREILERRILTKSFEVGEQE